MRIAKYFGKTIKLPDDDWKALINRLDPKDAVLEEGIYHIKKVSPLCKKYQITFKSISLGYSCSQCPFAIFRRKVGCVEFLELLKPSFRRIISCFYDEICWQEEDDKEARRILRDLRKHLFRMEEI